jgi:nicotinamidase-related amidase
MPKTIHGVIIDPQRSFCAVVDPARQQLEHDGELCVPGAWDAMYRVGRLINRLGGRLDSLSVTMDSHHLMHVAHPCWWRDRNGQQPRPFTILELEGDRIMGYDISHQLVGEYETFYRDVLHTQSSHGLPGHPGAIEMLTALKTGGRYPHCIWNPHTLIGTRGHQIVEPLMDSLLEWSLANKRTVNFVTKGSNPFVEHFSAVKAEVVDPLDNTTQINSEFIKLVMEDDEILLMGIAGSHCLANTVRDMDKFFSDDSFIRKCVLFLDGTAPVPGFEGLQDKFIADMVKRGMRTTTTLDYLAA